MHVFAATAIKILCHFLYTRRVRDSGGGSSWRTRFSFYRSLAHTDGRASKCCGEKSKVFRPHINQSGSTLHVIFFAARNNAFLINGKRGNWEKYFTVKSQTSLPITLSARPTHIPAGPTCYWSLMYPGRIGLQTLCITSTQRLAHSLFLPQRAANNNEMEKWRDEEAESAKHIKRLISTRLSYTIFLLSLL